MKTVIQVVHTESGEVAREFDVSNTRTRQIERMQRGIEINLSDEYHTCVVHVLPADAAPHNQQQGE